MLERVLLQSARRPGRAGRLVASTATRLPRQLMTNSPATQKNSIREVDMTCSRRPVAGLRFSEIDVREERWKGVVCEALRCISSFRLCCFSAMTGSSFFCPKKAPLTSPQIEGSRGDWIKSSEKSRG